MEEFIPSTTDASFSDTWNASTAETHAITTEKSYRTYPIYIVRLQMWRIWTPVLFVAGIFGNVMIVIIMRRMKGDSTINIYFTGTAVLDLLYLCTNTLGMWIRYTFDIRMEAIHNVGCKLYVWLYAGGSTVSCWYLVCMTVHRAMSVVWPHRVNLLCTRRTVLLLLSGITIFFAVLYSHYMIGVHVRTASNNSTQCIITRHNKNYIKFIENVFVYIELSVYCLIPFLCLAASNSVLVWKLAMSVKAAGTQLSQGNSEQFQAREKAANSVTLTVIVVSMAFLLLTLPASINYVLFYFNTSHNRVRGHTKAQIYFINAVCELLGHTNSTINFYLYCLTGRRFREEFIKIMCCGRNKQRRRPSSLKGNLSEQSTCR